MLVNKPLKVNIFSLNYPIYQFSNISKAEINIISLPMEKKVQVPNVKFWTGRQIPVVGLGTYLLKGQECIEAVKTAVKLGYRHIDTAAFYENETEIGKAIKECGVPREQLYIVSKIWSTDQGTQKATKAINDILARLDTSYVDLMLIHWPYSDQYDKSDPRQVEIRLETWRVMQKFRDQGKIKDIGVSNFLAHHLEKLIKDSGEKPVINQIEISPLLWQNDPIDYCQTHNIVVAGYSVLARNHEAIAKNQTLHEIGKKYGKTWSQVVVRWLTQRDIVTVVKAKSPDNLKANLAVFDFELTFEDCDKIKVLNSRAMRICEDPNDTKH